jgi:hypothetical protein
MTLEIQALAWERHTDVAGLNRLMGCILVIHKNHDSQKYIINIYSSFSLSTHL